ncbi:alpha/beta fold hydrolase [Halomonas llamarensis]|uniref:Alpha/beta hydrolase n=1 Tax=Halomonas llamarensis TaxID=2945104 RepID=A0ABT0SV03_9GAMM|nr:hypothetical protein [Halomonas llamarensis]MCL7931591.1 hypothetical protein [Halomonas llamarensis]
MFDDFEQRRIHAGDAEIFVCRGGSGLPLFTLVIPDLRGYGESTGLEPDSEHLGYPKRAMAQDIVEVMSALESEQFLLAGHG